MEQLIGRQILAVYSYGPSIVVECSDGKYILIEGTINNPPYSDVEVHIGERDGMYYYNMYSDS